MKLKHKVKIDELKSGDQGKTVLKRTMIRSENKHKRIRIPFINADEKKRNRRENNHNREYFSKKTKREGGHFKRAIKREKKI